MIPVQDVVSKVLSRLDAEGSDRYLFDQDLKPNINSSIEFIISVFNAAFSQKKLSEENLRELTRTRVWQANQFSRVQLDEADLGHEIWSIIAVMPDPLVHPNTPPPALADPLISEFKNDISYVSSDFSADRLSQEEWNRNRKNVFMAGNESLLNGFKRYAYLNPNDYSSSSYIDTDEIEIRPSVSSKLVAISYIKVPEKITQITDEIEFPKSLLELVSQKTANFITHKQGDGTNLFSVSNAEVAQLVQLMV